MDSVSVQLASTIGNTKLNELRIAYGRRNNPQTPSAVSGPGPVVQVQGVANFGGAPPPGDSLTPFQFEESYWQVVNNFSWIWGAHSLKAGADLQFVDDYRENDLVPQYIFSSTANYLAAKSGRTRSPTPSSARVSAIPPSATARATTASSCRTTGGWPTTSS